MKKKDIYLIMIIAAAALIIFAVTALNRSVEGNILRVTVDGELYGEYSLNENQTIEINTDYGTNTLIIDDGSAHMKEADCPDKYCIDQGNIRNNTETIVCLPHRVVAEVVSADSSGNEPAVDIIR